ncbi:M23 family metallopeptidase [Solirubrobacter phytolaccae]|uniref:M23 family metallopeptidase n=1 Tax=Solirubrobacter phytolaccae TaxID=1404360 RepID=A0A9X3NDQ7_9ACTN|nr:M23 family metallopeptidase [Solirubrobacter phytolaccae]MDA0183030.1 M23 family metallopeptidase [Solirubrobacter phytolaccae]
MFSKRMLAAGLGVALLGVLLVVALARAIPPTNTGWGTQADAPQYLPWTPGKAVWVSQGPYGDYSHRGEKSRFSWDFLIGIHEPVLTGVAGEVVLTFGGCDILDSQECGDGWGNHALLRVKDGTCARFAHLATVAVKREQRVAVGTPIGTVGSSGHSTEPHLHYQREECATGRALPSRFIEAGVPQAGGEVTSALGRKLD